MWVAYAKTNNCMIQLLDEYDHPHDTVQSRTIKSIYECKTHEEWRLQ